MQPATFDFTKFDKVLYKKNRLYHGLSEVDLEDVKQTARLIHLEMNGQTCSVKFLSAQSFTEFYRRYRDHRQKLTDRPHLFEPIDDEYILCTNPSFLAKDLGYEISIMETGARFLLDKYDAAELWGNDSTYFSKSAKNLLKKFYLYEDKLYPSIMVAAKTTGRDRATVRRHAKFVTVLCRKKKP